MGTQYHIGKYGLMRLEYLTANNKREYYQMPVFGKLNEYLHEVDVECHDMVERIAKQMKARAGVTEELKAASSLK